ncbi:MAG TPA: PaaI family thioesterase [Xanthobacteraceae bacterium]
MNEPDAMARLRAEMERPPYHAVLRPQPVAVDAESGTVTIRLPYREEFRRAPDAPGYHGGVIAALIDLAGHAAVAVTVGRMVPTIDLRIDFLRAPAGGDLTARGKLLRAGRSIARADVEIIDDTNNVVAVGRGTYSTL